MGKPRTCLAILFVSLLALQGCAPPACTRTTVAEYLDEQQRILEDWDAAWQSARLTAYDELTRGVAGLDAVRFNYNRLRPPRCMQRSHRLMLKAMDKSIDALDVYRAGLSEAEIRQRASEADELLLAAIAAMQEEVAQVELSAED